MPVGTCFMVGTYPGKTKLGSIKAELADHPSRVFEFPSPTLMHASAWATLAASKQESSHLLRMGWAGAGG